MLQPVTH